MLFFLVQWFCSYAKGLLVGGSVYSLGQHMDYTISKNSLDNLKTKNPELYADGQDAIVLNLVIISPILYMFVDQLVLDHQTSFSFIKCSGLLLLQNIGYFFAHREMHQNKSLYWIHHFHHLYEKDLIIPSIANAVSVYEFLFAYASPIVLGGYLLHVNEYEFAAAIEIISIFNLIIHTYELYNRKWVPGMVSPHKHIDHHRIRDKHYSAPIFDLDPCSTNY